MKGSWGRSWAILCTSLALFQKGVPSSARQRRGMLETHVKPGEIVSQSHALSMAGRAQAEDRKKWRQARQAGGLWQLLRAGDASCPRQVILTRSWGS